MSYANSRPQPCECCGSTGAIPVGIPDASGHLWTRMICEPCQKSCTTEPDGSGEGLCVHKTKTRWVVRWQSYAGDATSEGDCGWFETWQDAEIALAKEQAEFAEAATSQPLAETTFWVQGCTVDQHGNRDWLPD